MKTSAALLLVLGLFFAGCAFGRDYEIYPTSQSVFWHWQNGTCDNSPQKPDIQKTEVLEGPIPSIGYVDQGVDSLARCGRSRFDKADKTFESTWADLKGYPKIDNVTSIFISGGKEVPLTFFRQASLLRYYVNHWAPEVEGSYCLSSAGRDKRLLSYSEARKMFLESRYPYEAHFIFLPQGTEPDDFWVLGFSLVGELEDYCANARRVSAPEPFFIIDVSTVDKCELDRLRQMVNKEDFYGGKGLPIPMEISLNPDGSFDSHTPPGAPAWGSIRYLLRQRLSH